MSIFFVVHTPYHILLSCGIASLELHKKKYLIIVVEDIDEISKYKQIILSNDGKLFTDIFILNSFIHMHKIQDREYKIFVSLVDLLNKFKFNLLINLPINKLKMKDIIKRYVIPLESKTYIFADTNVNAQYFAKICSEHAGTVIYVEDGSAVYGNHIKNFGSIKKIMCKIIYGFWYIPLEVQGTSKYINKLMVAYPEFLRPELKRRNIEKIPDEAYKFLYDYLSPCLNKIFEIGAGTLDYVILLPHALSIKSKNDLGKIKLYKNIVENLIVNNKVGLKYHPREKNGYLSVEPNENLSLIPKSIPVEIVWMSSKSDKLKAVIGDNSTALLTSKKILGSNTNIICLGKLMNLNEESYNYMGKFGILIPESLEELMSYL